MVIGILTLELEIDHARSLKDKRSVLHRIKERARNRFNLAIAEVECQEDWHCAVLGAVTVSNDQRHCNRVLDKVVDLIETLGDCQLADYNLEFMRSA